MVNTSTPINSSWNSDERGSARAHSRLERKKVDQTKLGAPDPKAAVKARDRTAAALKNKQTRRSSKLDKDAALKGTLTEDDLRRGTDAVSILATRSEQGELYV
jgi:hypothetical protein